MSKKKQVYPVIITEYLTKIISVEAENENEAIDIATDMYNSDDIILDDSNYCTTEIEIWEDK